MNKKFLFMGLAKLLSNWVNSVKLFSSLASVMARLHKRVKLIFIASHFDFFKLNFVLIATISLAGYIY